MADEPTGAEGAPAAPQGVPYEDVLDHLSDLLARLDLRIRIGLHQQNLGAPSDPSRELRGLVLSEEEVVGILEPGADEAPEGSLMEEELRLLALELREATVRIEIREAASRALDVELPLLRVTRDFALCPFETELLVLCLAPELARHYEKLYAYLQDDITRKRPTVDLALRLLCEDPAGRVELRHCFHPSAPLLRFGWMRVEDPGRDEPETLLGRSLHLDDRVASFLLGSAALDPGLEGWVSLLDPEDVPARPELAAEQAGAEHAAERMHGEPIGGETTIVHLCGPAGAPAIAVAAAAARRLGRPLLLADGAGLPRDPAARANTCGRLVREAVLQPALLLLQNLELQGGDEVLYAAAAAQNATLLDAMHRFAGLYFLGGSRPWVPTSPEGDPVLNVALPEFDATMRADEWTGALAGRGSDGPIDVGALASHFRFTPGRIGQTVAAAERFAAWSRGNDAELGHGDLMRAARMRANPELSNLAKAIEPRQTWKQLVLPDEQRRQLRDLCEQARQRHRVLGTWGFGRRLSLGKGVAALFAGAPGTGKTMAAEVVAQEVGLDLYKVDLSQVVSKYIGETEKNLDRIFRAAQDGNAILLFDEADALFGKRSEVRDSHDRYANVEISFLLQRMEEYEGLSILATNLRKHIDEAFLRRIQVVVEFPFPDAERREEIWRGLFPPGAPIDPQIRYPVLATEVRLAGGNIKNIGLSAAFDAAARGDAISMTHLRRATEREFEKLGAVYEERSPGSWELSP